MQQAIYAPRRWPFVFRLPRPSAHLLAQVSASSATAAACTAAQRSSHQRCPARTCSSWTAREAPELGQLELVRSPRGARTGPTRTGPLAQRRSNCTAWKGCSGLAAPARSPRLGCLGRAVRAKALWLDQLELGHLKLGRASCQPRLVCPDWGPPWVAGNARPRPTCSGGNWPCGLILEPLVRPYAAFGPGTDRSRSWTKAANVQAACWSAARCAYVRS